MTTCRHCIRWNAFERSTKKRMAMSLAHKSFVGCPIRVAKSAKGEADFGNVALEVIAFKSKLNIISSAEVVINNRLDLLGSRGATPLANRAGESSWE
jgi:hypothetical protein